MALDAVKLIKLRDQIDTILKKREVEEGDQYKKLALSLENKLSQMKLPNSTDNVEVVEAVNRLGANIVRFLAAKPIDRTNDVITALARIERALARSGSKGSSEMSEEVLKAIRGLRIETPNIEFPNEMPVHVLTMPPQKIPQPVTNININPLRGFIETNAQTLTTALATVPAYGVLDNRRAVVVYNNDASTTVFLGGTDLTASNGMPLAPKSFSPPLDAGPKMIVYGLTSSGTAEIRVMELSNDAIGG